MVEQNKEDERHLIALKVTQALTVEACTLWYAKNASEEDSKAAKAILDYLASADTDSLVRLHAIMISA